jgi:hypothetical protein
MMLAGSGPDPASFCGQRSDHQPLAHEALGVDPGSVPIARPVPGEGNPQGLCLDKDYDCDDICELAVRSASSLRSAPTARKSSKRPTIPTGRRGAGSPRTVTHGLTATAGALIRWSGQENHLAF